MPGHARAYIEGVYEKMPRPRYRPLFRTTSKSGRQIREASIASANVKLKNGHIDEGYQPWDDALTPTAWKINLDHATAGPLGNSEVKPDSRRKIRLGVEPTQCAGVAVRGRDCRGRSGLARQGPLPTRHADRGKWSKLLVLHIETALGSEKEKLERRTSDIDL